MNFIAQWFQRVLNAEQPLKESLTVVDPASPNHGAELLTLTVIPGTEESPDSVLSIYWDKSQDKVFEKKYADEASATSDFNLFKTDLTHVQDLVKQNKLDEAAASMSSLLDNYSHTTDKIIDGNPSPLTTTMASEKQVPTTINGQDSFDYVAQLAHQVFKREHTPLTANRLFETMREDLHGYIIDIEDAKALLEHTKRSFFGKPFSSISKEAKVVMQNIFFSTPEEAIEYQTKMKALQPQDATTTIPSSEENPESMPSTNEQLGPPSVSYEDAEKQEAENEKNLTKRIETEVKDQVQSALDRKIATMFSDKDESLVQAMRGVGRTWEEIREYMVKNLKYDEDGVVAFLDQLKVEEQGGDKAPLPEELPLAEAPVLEAPKPPAELVSPETHDKLVHEVEEAKRLAEVQKKAEEPLETAPLPEVNPSPLAETPGIPEMRAPAPQGPSTIEVPLAPGDYVYVMSDVEDANMGFPGTFVSQFSHKGKDYAVVEEEGRGLKEVPMHLVTKASLKKSASFSIFDKKTKQPIDGPFKTREDAIKEWKDYEDKDNLYIADSVEASLNKQAEPPVNTPEQAVTEPTTVPKKYKITPKHVEQTDAVPATPEMEQTYRQIQIAEHNLDTIKTLIAQATAKFAEEKKRVEEQGGRLENEAQLQQQISKLAKLVEATQSKLVGLGDSMVYLKQEEAEVPVKWNDREKLERIYKKFPDAEKYIEQALAGAQRLATTENIRELIFFPKKLSKLDKKTNLTDTLSSIYDNLVHALQSILSPESK